MRRFVLALVAVLALTFVSACGASGGDDDAAEETSTTVSTDGSPTDTETTETEPDDTEPDYGTTSTTEGDQSSSGDLVEVEVWAEEFCGDFETWLDGIQATSAEVGEAITPGDLEGAKTAIIGLFGDVAAQTQTLIDEIEGGGAPDIDDGEAFLDDLLAKFEDFHAAIESARAKAEGVSTADPAAFQSTITELIATFQTETETVGNSFSELDAKYGDADLDEAVTGSCDFM